jgi:hypothetical protein
MIHGLKKKAVERKRVAEKWSGFVSAQTTQV